MISEPSTFAGLAPLPIYVSSLDAYMAELKGCRVSRSGIKNIKRAARRAVVRGLQILAEGGVPSPATKECKQRTQVKYKDALRAYTTSEASRKFKTTILAHAIVADLALTLSAVLGSWAPDAFVLVKGGAAMRYHFDVARSQTPRDAFMEFEKDNLAAVIALEPSDFDAELSLAPSTPRETRQKVEQAADLALSAARGKLQQSLGEGKWSLRRQTLRSDAGNPFTLFRLVIDIGGVTAEFFDLSIPSAEDPKAVSARKRMLAGDLVEYPLG